MDDEYLFANLFLANFVLGILVCLNAFFGKLKSLNLVLMTIFAIFNIIMAIIIRLPSFLKCEYEERFKNEKDKKAI